MLRAPRRWAARQPSAGMLRRMRAARQAAGGGGGGGGGAGGGGPKPHPTPAVAARPPQAEAHARTSAKNSAIVSPGCCRAMTQTLRFSGAGSPARRRQTLAGPGSQRAGRVRSPDGPGAHAVCFCCDQGTYPYPNLP